MTKYAPFNLAVFIRKLTPSNFLIFSFFLCMRKGLMYHNVAENDLTSDSYASRSTAWRLEMWVTMSNLFSTEKETWGFMYVRLEYY